jgi:hypothetical protein
MLLHLLPGTFNVCRLPPTSAIPSWAIHSSFFSISKTTEELSIVCTSEEVPEGVLCEKDWIVYKVKGPLDFSLTGILASIAVPLAQAQIPIFAISTYNTDYILIKQHFQKKGTEALKKAGFSFE